MNKFDEVLCMVDATDKTMSKAAKIVANGNKVIDGLESMIIKADDLVDTLKEHKQGIVLIGATIGVGVICVGAKKVWGFVDDWKNLDAIKRANEAETERLRNENLKLEIQLKEDENETID